MSEKTVNAHARIPNCHAYRQLDQGGRIVIARPGKSVAALRPTRKVKKRHRPIDDPLLRVEEYSYVGPIGLTASQDIDRTVYGASAAGARTTKSRVRRRIVRRKEATKTET